MICLVSESPLCVAAMILYACVWVPIREAKNTVVSLVMFVVMFAYHRPIEVEAHNDMGWTGPIFEESRLEELRDGTEVDETCSICLMEFEGQDLVTQLSKCGHVFHINCIEKWLDCNNFTCPLCRSSFLQNPNANSHPKNHHHHHNHHDHDHDHDQQFDLHPYVPSYLGFSWH